VAKYKYTALDLQSKKFSGEVNARDDADLKRILRGQGLTPVKYHTVEAKATNYRMKANEMGEFSRQLANMLASGITIVRAMEIIKDRDFKPKIKQVYEKLHGDIQQGLTLSEGMKLQDGVFPELLINMYASGEASGQLEQVADKMGTHYEKEHRLNGKVKSAMTYPIVLLVVTLIVVMVIFAVVLPTFFLLFEDIELPGITQVMLAISGFIQHYWYTVIIGVLIGIALFRFLLRIYAVSYQVDRAKLKIRIIGPLLKIVYTARFARTLSSLYSSGISMLSALEITATIIGNKYIEAQFVEVVKDVRNGDPLSVTVHSVDGFDKKLGTTILIGEESGRLDAMLESTAESFDYEAEMATDRLVQLIQPVMIVVLATVVGGIVLSVMLPMLELYQNI